MSVDTTGRLKVAEPLTLFEYYPNLLDSSSIDKWITTIYSESAVTAADESELVYNSTYNALDLTLKTGVPGTNQIITRESKTLLQFQPGKARTVLLALTPIISSGSDPVNTASGSIFSRVGIFIPDNNATPATNYYKKTPKDGFYFQVSIDDAGTKTLNWCYVYNTTVTTVAQSSWNIDIFNGSGASGKTLNSASMEQTLLCVIEQECCVGRVKVGFRIDGITYWAHQFTQTDTTAFQVDYGYNLSPLCPIVYQIGCVDTSLANNVIQRQLFSSCMSEGGQIMNGNICTYSTATSNVDGMQLNDSNRRIILAVKINTSTYSNCYFSLLSMSGMYYSNTGYNNDDNIIIEVYVHTSYDKSTFNSTTNIGTLDGAEQSFTAISNSILTGYVGSSATNRYVNNDGLLIGTYFLEKGGLNKNITFNNLNTSRLNISEYDTVYFTARTTQLSANDIHLSLNVNFNQYI